LIQELANEDVICSGSLFTNSNWFAFDEDKALNDRLVSPEASPSPNSEISALKEDDEVILGEVIDDTEGSEPTLPVSNKDANEESGHTVLANGTIDKWEDDIRPPTPDVKESQPEFVEWKEEEAEPGDVAEKDTAVPGIEVESEKQLNSMDDVMLCDAELGEEKKSGGMLGSSAPEAEAASPVSSDIDSIKHPEQAADSAVSEYPMGEQNPEI
jgi:serine/threonine-protein phosphatase 6 regulatory subunit 3